MLGYVSPRFDFPPPHGKPGSFYVVASTYRSGSSFLALNLWSRGLGAPWEYLNYEADMRLMMARLGCEELDKYIDMVAALRTAPNGVFAIKSHYHHFDSALNKSKRIRELSQVAKFIYIDRKDKLAQAVSFAKSVQTNAWMSAYASRAAPLFYSADLIASCMKEIKRQSEGWWSWFSINDIAPFVVDYDELTSNERGTVERIAGYLGVRLDLATRVELPMPARQRDETNIAWMEQFRLDLARNPFLLR